MALWLVRAGRHGERETLAIEKSVVVIGWTELPDLSGIHSREALFKAMEENHPDAERKTLVNWTGQVWAFLRTILREDLVALPLKSRSAIAIGRITGDYDYRADLPEDARHTRPVEWLGEWSRNAFDQDLLYSFGAFMTVCRIQRNHAEERVRAIVEGRKPTSSPAREDDDSATDIAIAHDIEQWTRDQIRTFIGKKFRSHELTRLIAAILRAQGYQAQESPEGPDGGVDIIAGKGLLGFDPPRLAVQVKSSDSPIDVKVLRELQGVMKNFGAAQGLFVSWGGFKGSVAKEAARVYFEIRLWDADDVVRMVQAYYADLPEAIQAELPLKRIWTLVQSEEEPLT